MKPSHGNGPDADQNPNTPPSITAPIVDRHFASRITVGPIPGLPVSEPVPKVPERTPAEELAAALAYVADHPWPSMDSQDLTDEVDVSVEEYEGPVRAVPMPKAAWPSSMVSSASETPAEIWNAICEEAAKQGPVLTQAEVDDLWLVHTNRPGRLMLLICPERDMVPYLDGVSPYPVTISGASAFMTLTGEAQSLSGYDRHGAAARTLGRLAHFDSVRAEAIRAILDSRQHRA